MIYMVWWHLVPEIQKFHNLIPGDCLIAGAPVLVNYTMHGHMIVVAHVPVDVRSIECHGEIGHGMDMTDVQGMRHFDARNDVIFCKEGASLKNGSTAYIKIDNWRWLDEDEREDAIDKYKEGENYFCWVDPEQPVCICSWAWALECSRPCSCLQRVHASSAVPVFVHERPN